MFARVVFVLVASAWGLNSPHKKAQFLHTHAELEVVTPPATTLNFSPMSTTMQCILSLTLQYFCIYTALGICRTVMDFQGVPHDSSGLQKALKHASETMFYAPMVCMMFVGFRMRVLQLTKGQGAPQPWVQNAMHAVTYSILASTVLTLVVPIFTSTDLESEKTGELKMDSKTNPFANPVLQAVFNVIRYLIVIGLYAGFGCVLVGLYKFAPEPGTWDGEVPPISPAVGCTVMLSSTFFLIYFLLAVSRTYSQYATAGNTGESKFDTVMTRAADTLGLAPMLCAMFLAARMRALQMDPVSGNPQKWAQNCFWMCSIAIICQTGIAIVVPLLLNGKVADAKEGQGKYLKGDAKVDLGDEQSLLSKCFTVARFLIMLCVYVGAVAVVCSVFTIQHPDGKELTPPLSPTMQCVLNLAFQYFLIYALLWVFITVEDFTSINLLAAKDAIHAAKSTVQFAPMLAVLFIATRMRALQMTDNKGAPQGWVQDGMYLATWAVMIQFMMCLLMPFFTGHKYMADAMDGSTSEKAKDGYMATEKDLDKGGHQWGAMVVTFVRYTALIALLGGVTTVTIGVFMMTPETANGRGAIPLVADGTLPVDLAPEPYGINDVPGAKSAMKGVGETVGAGANAVDGAGAAVTETAAGATEAVTGF